MHHEVTEDDLPGIGRRFTIACDDGGVLTVIVHNSGRRDVYVASSGRREPETVSLDDFKAREVGAIISGEYSYRSAPHELDELKEEIEISSLTLTPGSPGAGRSLADLGAATLTGITIITILRGRSVIHEPDGFEILQPGDGLIVAGRRTNLPAFFRLVAGA